MRKFTHPWQKLFQRLLALACCIVVTLAGPRYIAIPIDGVDVIELNPISPSSSSSSRLPRQAETYIPVTLQHEYEPQPSRNERAHTAHILDYVDFGAHTGPNGAFSWYADYPSHH